MKETRLMEVTVCDFCGSTNGVYHQCLECKKDLCYDCMKKNLKTYYHAVSCSGSGDGYYCFSCLGEVIKNNDPLLRAYQRIESLRLEADSFYERYREEAEKAEEEIKRLRHEQGLH